MSYPSTIRLGAFAFAFALTFTAFVAELSGCNNSAPRAAHQSTELARSCSPGDPTYAAQVRPLVDRYCSSCHSASGDAGEEHDFTQPALLHAQQRLVSARLRAHSMPPRTSPQPDAAEVALLAHWADCGAPLD